MRIRTAMAITLALSSLSGIASATDVSRLKGQAFDLDGQSFIIVGITKTADGTGIRAFTVVPASAKATIESRRWNSTEEAMDFLKSQRQEIAANRFRSMDVNGVKLVYDANTEVLIPAQAARGRVDETALALQALHAKQAQAEYQSRQAQRAAPQTGSSQVPSQPSSVAQQPTSWPYRDTNGMIRIPTAEELDPQTFQRNRTPFRGPVPPPNFKPFYIGDPSSPMEQLHRVAEDVDRRNTEFLRTASRC